MNNGHVSQVAAIYSGGGGPAPGPPAWVESLKAPSGALPSVVLDFQNGRYWAGSAIVSITAAVASSPDSLGSWNAVTAISPGKGLDPSAAKNSGTLQIFPPGWLTNGFTVLMLAIGDPVPVNDPSFPAAAFFQVSTYDIPAHNNIMNAQMEPSGGPPPPENVQESVLNLFGGGAIGGAPFVTMTAPHCRTAFNFGWGTNNGALSVETHAVISGASTAPGTPLHNIDFFANRPVAGVYGSLFAFYDLQPEADLPAICALT